MSGSDTAGVLKRVAVLGRPNVGKSTLFNRLLGRREAIVEERPGVTRDRKLSVVDWQGRRFELVDTGGWMAASNPDSVEAKVSFQAEAALRECDLVLFVVDVTTGITDQDQAAAGVAKRAGVDVILVVNKVDNQQREAEIWDFMALGLGDPMPLSSLHGLYSGELLDLVVERLSIGIFDEQYLSDDPTGQANAGETSPPAIAIIGRPNVGKSTMFNRLVGDDRSVVHDMPGTTRDTVDTVIETPNGSVKLVDTAGMRRKSRVDGDTEYYSNLRSLRAIENADVAILVLDSSEGVTAQDARLAERADAVGCAMVLVFNKWDLIDTETRLLRRAELADRLPFLSYAPVLKSVATTGMGLTRVLKAVEDAVTAQSQRVPTAALNEVIERAQQAHPAVGARVLYATQGAINPPTITLFTNRSLPAPYLRYLERKVRESFQIEGALKLRVRPRSG